MSHKIFNQNSREVAKFIKITYLLFVVTATSFTAMGLIEDQLLILPVNASIIDLPKFDCINNSSNSNTDCTSLPNIKPDIQKVVETKSFAGIDIVGIIKSIGRLAINLFLMVIQTLVGVLKSILPFLR